LVPEKHSREFTGQIDGNGTPNGIGRLFTNSGAIIEG